MINFNTHLIEPIQFALNNALGGQTSGAFNYHINDVPKNYRYAFIFNTDTGDYMHAEKVYESGTLHDDLKIYFNGNTTVQPVSREGITETAYNALIDATIEFSVPLGQVRGATRKAFINEIRRLVDDTLQSSKTRVITVDGTVYQIGTQYNLLTTGIRQNRSSVGDSIDYLLRLSFSIIAGGVSSDKINLYIDGERIFFEHIGFARKVVKEMAAKSSDVSQTKPVPPQKSLISSTYFSLNFDMPARFSTVQTGTSFNEKVAAFTLSNASAEMNVKVEYPKTVSFNQQGEAQFSYEGALGYVQYTMKFDTVGINGETGVGATHSITLVEV